MKKFLTVSVVKHWNSLHYEAGDAPALEIFKAMFEGALKEQFDLAEDAPAIAGGLELHEVSGLFQLKLFYDTVILYTTNIWYKKKLQLCKYSASWCIITL